MVGSCTGGAHSNSKRTTVALLKAQRFKALQEGEVEVAEELRLTIASYTKTPHTHQRRSFSSLNGSNRSNGSDGPNGYKGYNGSKGSSLDGPRDVGADLLTALHDSISDVPQPSRTSSGMGTGGDQHKQRQSVHAAAVTSMCAVVLVDGRRQSKR